ncbi:MAG: hypothetical protein ABJ327_26835 [Litoreibacter sp.]
MLKDLRDILTHSPKALAQDALGICAIGVMMTVVLYFPGVS